MRETCIRDKRSNRSANRAVYEADKEIEKMNSQIDKVNVQQSIFFNARRNIAKVACKVAEANKVDLLMLRKDSVKERGDYYTGQSTACTHSLQSSLSIASK